VITVAASGSMFFGFRKSPLTPLSTKGGNSLAILPFPFVCLSFASSAFSAVLLFAVPKSPPPALPKNAKRVSETPRFSENQPAPNRRPNRPRSPLEFHWGFI
jgi:hypothetical protein